MTKLDPTITIGYGAGGKLSGRLIRELILKYFDDPALAPLSDAAYLTTQKKRIAMTTDSYVVSPLFFPGGDIGTLAACGTINDLAVSGARPIALTCGLIIEEGLATDELEKILASIAKKTSEAGIPIVAGDTKVVEKGSCDKLFINTAGIGEMIGRYRPKPLTPGDRIIVSGTLGDHGATIFNAREKIVQSSKLRSDCASVLPLVLALEPHLGAVKIMRDPTRGGLAAIVNELIGGQRVSAEIDEESIPINKTTMALCELCGFDPLYLANEGKLVAICAEENAEDILKALKSEPLGAEAAIIGEVTDDPEELVSLRTLFGGSRILDIPTSGQIPRIC